MKKFNVVDYLPNLLEHKDLLACFSILIVLAFLVSYATSSLVIAYHEKQQTEEQMASMTSYINQWKEKSSHINNASMRPVTEKQMDNVQTDVIFNVQSNQLNLTGLKEQQGKKEESGKAFDMEFVGDYPQTIQCLQRFSAKDALISFRKMSMEMKDGKIHTKLTYKIYTK